MRTVTVPYWALHTLIIDAEFMRRGYDNGTRNIHHYLHHWNDEEHLEAMEALEEAIRQATTIEGGDA